MLQNKNLVSLTVLSLVAVALAGCAGDSNQESTNPGGGTTTGDTANTYTLDADGTFTINGVVYACADETMTTAEDVCPEYVAESSGSMAGDGTTGNGTTGDGTTGNGTTGDGTTGDGTTGDGTTGTGTTGSADTWPQTISINGNTYECDATGVTQTTADDLPDGACPAYALTATGTSSTTGGTDAAADDGTDDATTTTGGDGTTG